MEWLHAGVEWVEYPKLREVYHKTCACSTVKHVISPTQICCSSLTCDFIQEYVQIFVSCLVKLNG